MNKNLEQILAKKRKKKLEKDSELLEGMKILRGPQGKAGKPGKDGKDGRSPSKKAIIEEVLSKIPIPKDGKAGKDSTIPGPKGEKGDTPKHRWKGTKLQFEKPDGSWGDMVELLGPEGKKGKDGNAPEHEVNGLKVRFRKPDGKWGEWLNFEPVLQKAISLIQGASRHGGGGATPGFLGLNDTPDSYQGADGYYLKVQGNQIVFVAGGPGGGGASAWGEITGTLADQTDLQTALNGKSDTGHTHDDRYYTESETDTEISDAITAHVGQADPHTQYQKESEKGSANGYAPLGADSKIASAYLPAIALTDVFVVASQVAQLALTAEEGDVAIRTDLNKSYIHNGGTAGTMADWSELLTPTDAVLSVNGFTGAVSLTTANVADSADKRYVTDAQQTAIGTIGSKADDSDVVHNTGNESIAGQKTVVDGFFDNAGTPILSVGVTQRGLYYSDGAMSIGWNSGILYNPSGAIALNWDNRHLVDSGGAIALEWQARQLIAPDNTYVVDWASGRVLLRDLVAGFNGALDVSLLTADREYFLQDGDGTLAFLTDIPSIAGLADAGANSDITSLLGLTGEIRLDTTPATDDVAVGMTTNSYNAGETIAQWDLLYMDSTGKWMIADASAVATSGGMLAMACEAGTTDTPLKVALPTAFIRNDDWAWTPGATLYADITAGAITETAPSGTDEVIRVIGFAMSADMIHFNPSSSHITHT